MWEAGQYLKFADERGRPFFDLLARVHGEMCSVVDLGCGPGNLTRTLKDRWPAAHVLGIDNSPEMLHNARPLASAGRLDFIQADIAEWSPPAPVDLIVSNAALHWVPDHARLMDRLAGFLGSRGVLAVQIPYHFDSPAHQAIEQTRVDSRWRQRLEGVGQYRDNVMSPQWYVERLLGLGLQVDAWQTTYMHLLRGENPVLEWFKGTALRPLLNVLDAGQQAEFLHQLGDRLRAVYPPTGSVTLLPFSRLFFVARFGGVER